MHARPSIRPTACPPARMGQNESPTENPVARVAATAEPSRTCSRTSRRFCQSSIADCRLAIAIGDGVVAKKCQDRQRISRSCSPGLSELCWDRRQRQPGECRCGQTQPTKWLVQSVYDCTCSVHCVLCTVIAGPLRFPDSAVQIVSTPNTVTHSCQCHSESNAGQHSQHAPIEVYQQQTCRDLTVRPVAIKIILHNTQCTLHSVYIIHIALPTT